MSLMQDPAGGADPVTPSDTTDLGPTRGIYVGTTGDLVVIMRDRSVPRTFYNVPEGIILPIRVRRVMAATTASDLLALY